jgi:prepilin-type N-terminal cleavage/methylation domain-containing protein
MKLKSLRQIRNNHGVNLVELMVTVLIASIFMLGLVSAYASGIQYYKDSISLGMMYSDGITVFRKIEKLFRGADNISLLQWGYPNERVTLHIPNYTGGIAAGGTVEIYYDSRTRTLRMDDGRADHMEYNVALLPPVYYTGRRRTATYAYNVKSVAFEQALDLYPNPTDEDRKLVRMRMVLADPDGGDTLSLQFTAVNLNVPQN